MTAVIRAAVPADLPFLLGLTPRLADFPVPPWRTADQIARADHAILRQALQDHSGESCILVAEDPEPAGYVFCTTRRDYFTGAPHAHVEVVAVAEWAQGKGLARQLMDAAEDWGRRRGYDHITLNVFDANSRARGLYQRLGYAPETIHYFKSLTGGK